MGGASTGRMAGNASGGQSAAGGGTKQPQVGMIGMAAGDQSMQMPGMTSVQTGAMGGAMVGGGAMAEGGGAMPGTGPMDSQMMMGASGASAMAGAGPMGNRMMGGSGVMMTPSGTMPGSATMPGQTGALPGGIVAQTSRMMPMTTMRFMVGSPSMAPPGFEEPCKCEVECCQMPMEPRRPLPILHLPMVLHYGCCGCVDCPASLNPFIAFRIRYTMMMARSMRMRPGMANSEGEPPDVISR